MNRRRNQANLICRWLSNSTINGIICHVYFTTNLNAIVRGLSTCFTYNCPGWWFKRVLIDVNETWRHHRGSHWTNRLHKYIRRSRWQTGSCHLRETRGLFLASGRVWTGRELRCSTSTGGITRLRAPNGSCQTITTLLGWRRAHAVRKTIWNHIAKITVKHVVERKWFQRRQICHVHGYIISTRLWPPRKRFLALWGCPFVTFCWISQMLSGFSFHREWNTKRAVEQRMPGILNILPWKTSTHGIWPRETEPGASIRHIAAIVARGTWT